MALFPRTKPRRRTRAKNTLAIRPGSAPENSRFSHQNTERKRVIGARTRKYSSRKPEPQVTGGLVRTFSCEIPPPVQFVGTSLLRALHPYRTTDSETFAAARVCSTAHLCAFRARRCACHARHCAVARANMHLSVGGARGSILMLLVLSMDCSR